MKRAKIKPRSVSDVDKIIGQRIRERRLQLGMGQEVLAGAIGVTFQQVQKYERGVNRVAAATLLDIAETLGQPVSWFLPTKKSGDAEEIEELSAVYSNLSPSGRKLLLDTARTFDSHSGMRRTRRPPRG